VRKDAVRKTVLALAITVMATPALAQLATSSGGPNLMGEGVGKLKTDVEVKKEQEAEAGYKSGLSKIPDPKKTGKADPWGGVRGNSTSGTSSK
jgi:hypothetical protein